MGISSVPTEKYLFFPIYKPNIQYLKTHCQFYLLELWASFPRKNAVSLFYKSIHLYSSEFSLIFVQECIKQLIQIPKKNMHIQKSPFLLRKVDHMFRLQKCSTLVLYIYILLLLNLVLCLQAQQCQPWDLLALSVSFQFVDNVISTFNSQLSTMLI